MPDPVRLFDAFTYKTRSWPKAKRVLMKAEVMALGEIVRTIASSRRQARSDRSKPDSLTLPTKKAIAE